MKNLYDMPCNIAQTLNIIGDKWSLLILHEMAMGHHTYAEIRKGLDGIPTNLLSGRLKSLEADGLITSTLYVEHPPRYQYQLTEAGQDLEDVLNCLVLWGEKHLSTCYKKLSHNVCGEPVEIRYFCPKCGKAVEKSELCVQPFKERM